MITAVDTNVLIDIFRDDPRFGSKSAAALRQCLREGRVAVCDVVWAEVAAYFPRGPGFDAAMSALPIEFVPMTAESAKLAGDAWKSYRSSGGDRTRVVADFLIAAHAQVQCDRLLTRDLGFYRSHFKKLRILDPKTHKS